MASSGAIASSMVMKVDDYEVYRDDLSELGSGTFGVVCRGKHLGRPSHGEVAVKRVALAEDTAEGKKHNRYVDMEIEILKAIDHENIVTLFHSQTVNNFKYLFLELCDERDLKKFILKEKQVSFPTCLGFMRDISAGLRCLHEQKPSVIHRDVKPSNMLVKKDTTLGRYVIKLGDLGLARTGDATTACGAPDWLAPEVYPDSSCNVCFSIECDVYGGGLNFLSLLDHKPGEALEPPKSMLH